LKKNCQIHLYKKMGLM